MLFFDSGLVYIAEFYSFIDCLYSVKCYRDATLAIALLQYALSEGSQEGSRRRCSADFYSTPCWLHVQPPRVPGGVLPPG